MNDINKNVISTVNRQLYPYHRLDDIKAVKLQAGYIVLAVLCNKYDTSNVSGINIYANLLDMKVYLEAEMDFWSLNKEEINVFSDLLLLFDEFEISRINDDKLKLQFVIEEAIIETL